MANLLKHYIVGYDRPTPGQVKTLWPPEELPGIHGANNEIVYFVERHSATVRDLPPGAVIYRVEPWQSYVFAGRFERTVDGTIPPRDVEHAHAVLIDPKPSNNSYLLPSDLQPLFVGARQYRRFHSLRSEFYREISTKFKINYPISISRTSGTSDETHIRPIEDLVELLANNVNSEDRKGIAELLTNLPDPLQFYVTWGFASLPQNMDRTDDSQSSLTAIVKSTRLNETNDRQISIVAAQVFDIVAPNVTITKAYEIAGSVLDLNPQRMESTEATAQGLLRLVKQGISPDRIGRALCSNAPRMYLNWTDSWNSILNRSLIGLYPGGWQSHLDKLGYPYLRLAIEKSGQPDNAYDSPTLKNKLFDSVGNDKRYRLFVDELKKSNDGTILETVGLLTEISNAHIEAIIGKYESLDMARILHQAISTEENYTATIWPTILRISSTVSNSMYPNHAKWWNTSLGKATDTSRSLLKKITRRQQTLEQFALEYYDHTTVEHIEQIARLPNSDDNDQTVANLTKLLNILQRKTNHPTRSIP